MKGWQGHHPRHPEGGPHGRLLQRVEGLFTPLTHVPEEQLLSARLLNGLVLASFPVLLSAVAVRLVLGIRLAETANLALVALAVAGTLGTLILRSGRVYLAGFVLMFALWAAGTSISWMHPGVREAGFVILLFAVVVALAVLPWPTGYLLTLLSLSSIWLHVALESRGLLTPGVANPVKVGFAFSLILILFSLMAFVFGRVLRRAVLQAIAAQQALSKSEKELASILRRTPNIICRLDTEGRITYANEAVRRYGYEPSRLLGTHLLDYVHPEDGDLARRSLAERRTGDRGTKELEIRLLDSESRTVPTPQESVFLVQAEGLYENGSGPERYVGTQGIATDISDRKRVEEALQKSEEKYSKVFQLAPAGFIVATLNEARILDVNEEFERKTGYRREELIGRSAMDIGLWVDPGQREHVASLLRRGEPARELEVKVRAKNGDVRIARYNAQKICIGGTDCLFSAAEDITDRKRAEVAFQKSEEKYSKVFRAVPVGVAIATLDEARIIDVNEELERISGYRRDELVGRVPSGVGLWVDPGEKEQVINLVKRNEPAKDLEVRWRAKTGDLRIVRLNAQRINIEGSVCLLVTAADITERKHLESQLQQAQKLEAVGRLAGGIAHDFNNMLAVILGQAEMASSELEPANPIYESILEIRKAAERSAELTRQLLMFARKQDTAPRVLSLNQAISERLGMLRRLIGENIALEWNPGPDLWPVKMEPSQADQILVNLSVNARDAIFDVGKLTITTENRLREGVLPQHADSESPHEWVLLSVADTGTGMSEETSAHIFEPFFTTKEVGRGTGMGLATVHGIVQQDGGWIEAESQIGKGTTFRIYLPRAHEEVLSVHEAGQGQLASGHETLLVVEDESALRRLIGTNLQRLGYTVLEAGSAEEALALVAGHERLPDLLLTDVVMPVMNGRDLYAKVAALHPGIRVIFMSGYSADVFARPGDSGHGFAFLPKPFSMRQLSAMVREVLDSH